MNFNRCPRCRQQSFERLASHGYCVACDYSPDLEDSERMRPPSIAGLAFKEDARSLELALKIGVA